MIGFIFLLLAFRQIYIIIKNGLTARQIREASSGEGVRVLIAVKDSDFLDASYLQKLESFPLPHQISLMVTLDHPQILELGSRRLELLNYNPQLETVIDVINRQCTQTQMNSILITDANVIFDERGLFGLEKILTETKGPFCIIPQVHSENMTVDCLYTLNPNLALISLLSFKRLTRSRRHPLLNATELALAFRKVDFEVLTEDPRWKSSLFASFHQRAIGLKMCFGEKFFSVYMTPELGSLWQRMTKVWQVASGSKDYSALSFFVQLIIWTFPILFFESHPFYSLGIVFLLLIYRIFTFIIFQENILSIFVHPIAGLMWLGSLVWNQFNQLRNR